MGQGSSRPRGGTFDEDGYVTSGRQHSHPLLLHYLWLQFLGTSKLTMPLCMHICAGSITAAISAADNSPSEPRNQTGGPASPSAAATVAATVANSVPQSPAAQAISSPAPGSSASQQVRVACCSMPCCVMCCSQPGSDHATVKCMTHITTQCRLLTFIVSSVSKLTVCCGWFLAAASALLLNTGAAHGTGCCPAAGGCRCRCS